MTAGELLEEKLNISRATLYRKIDKMLATEILDIYETKIVRGQIEKKYCIRNIVISEQASNSERLETVTLGLMNLITQYSNYFTREDADAKRDKLFMMNYNIALSDEDYSSLVQDMLFLIDKYQKKNCKGAQLRSLHLLSTPTENVEE